MGSDWSSSVQSAANPEHLLEQLTLLSQQLQQTPTLESLLAIAVQMARRLIQSDRVVIYQLLHDGDGWIAAESVGDGISPLQGQLIYDPCFKTHWEVPYTNGQIRQIDDIEITGLTPCYRAMLRRFQVRANLVVPILVEQGSPGHPPITAHSQLWGLAIAHQCLQPRSWQAIDRHILRHISVQISLALRHLTQQQQLQTLHQTLEQSVVHPTQTANSLQPSTAQFAGILEIANDAVITIDASQRITLFNQGAEKIFGYTANEVLYQPLNLLLPQRFAQRHERHVDNFSQVHESTPIARRMGSDRSEVWGRRKDGSEFPAEVSISRLQQGDQTIYAAILRDITAQKEAEDQLRRQTERERMIYEIAQEIRRSLDLDHILQTTVDEVRNFLQVERVLIYRFEADWSGVIITESRAPGIQSILGLSILDSYFAETCGRDYQLGYVKATDDVYTAGFAPCHIELMERLQVRAKLVVPIRQGEQLWGLLVAHQCSEARHWQPADSELLTQLSIQVAIAIQQSELHEQVNALNATLEDQVRDRTIQLQKALEFEALVKRITDGIRDSLDEATILTQVVQELAIALNAEGCDTGIYSQDRTITSIQYEYRNGSFIEKNWSFEISQSSDPRLYDQLFRGQSCLFCLISRNIKRPADIKRTILACPIMDDQDILGDLWLFKPSDQVFTDAEIRLAQQVANQCAIALRQSRLYQSAQVQVQELERLNRLKDDFLSTVSHELRTPVASINMATQLLEIALRSRGIDLEQDTNILRYFQILRDECQREIQLVNDLLDLTRLDADTERPNPIGLLLQIILPHVAEPYLLQTQQRQQQLRMVIPPDLPSVTTDLFYLERIFSELLENACKYTPDGEVIEVTAAVLPQIPEDIAERLAMEEEPLVPTAGSAFQITVRNFGVEIPTAELDLIFDKFYRIPNHDPWRYSGTGLGLALVKRLATFLGGTIAVTSGDRHTTFTVTLPNLIEPEYAN